jgi:hypothetical protein
MLHQHEPTLHKNKKEEWRHVKDPVERRKIQNRISQRTYRKAAVYQQPFPAN